MHTTPKRKDRQFHMKHETGRTKNFEKHSIDVKAK